MQIDAITKSEQKMRITKPEPLLIINKFIVFKTIFGNWDAIHKYK